MASKTNGLYRLINGTLLFALAGFTLSWNTKPDIQTNLAAADSLPANTAITMDTTMREINLVDTIRNLMTISLLKDTLEYKAFDKDNRP